MTWFFRFFLELIIRQVLLVIGIFLFMCQDFDITGFRWSASLSLRKYLSGCNFELFFTINCTILCLARVIWFDSFFVIKSIFRWEISFLLGSLLVIQCNRAKICGTFWRHCWVIQIGILHQIVAVDVLTYLDGLILLNFSNLIIQIGNNLIVHDDQCCDFMNLIVSLNLLRLHYLTQSCVEIIWFHIRRVELAWFSIGE